MPMATVNVPTVNRLGTGGIHSDVVGTWIACSNSWALSGHYPCPPIPIATDVATRFSLLQSNWVSSAHKRTRTDSRCFDFVRISRPSS